MDFDVDISCHLDLGNRRSAKRVFTIDIEAHAPESDLVHNLLGGLKVAIPSEDGVDELRACLLAHGLCAVTLSCLQHECLAFFEKSLELVPKSLSALDEVMDSLLLLNIADATDAFLSSLHLPRKLDEQKPKLTRHVSHGSGGTMMKDRPIIDPLAEGIGIEDTSE